MGYVPWRVVFFAFETWRVAFLNSWATKKTPRENKELQICPLLYTFLEISRHRWYRNRPNYWWNQGLAAWFRAKSPTMTRGWFFIFPLTWGNNPIWLVDVRKSSANWKARITAWRITPVSKWLGSPPISQKGHLEGEEPPYLGDLLNIVTNHLRVLGWSSKWPNLQARKTTAAWGNKFRLQLRYVSWGVPRENLI